MYGYTQAKALVYSKYGEPKDVLRSVNYIAHSIALPAIYQAHYQFENTELRHLNPVYTNTPSPHPTVPR
jgi:hypothetical protein